MVASTLVFRFLLPILLDGPARSPVTGLKFSLSNATKSLCDSVALREEVVKANDEDLVTMAFGRVTLDGGVLDTAS